MRILALMTAMLLAASRMSLAAETEASAPAAPAEEGYYVVSMAMTQEPGQDQAGMEVLMGHIGHLTALYDQGVLFMAGPFDESGHEGISIVRAHSVDEARGFFSDDPTVAAGMMQITAVHPWWAAYSRPDNMRFSPEQLAAMMGGEAGDPHSAHSAAAAGEAAPAEAGGSSSGGEGGMEMTPGGIDFIQVPAADTAASSAFYSKVFGWEVMSQSGMSFFTAPGGMMGEFSTELKPAAAQTGPVFFITTSSVNAKAPEVEAAGGMVLVPPMELPDGMGYIAIIADVAGNAVGIWSAGE